MRLIVIVLLGFFATNLYALDSLRVEQDGGEYFVIHKVESGETLYSLAKRYGAKLSEVISINSIENNQIALSQELRIPIAAPINSSKTLVSEASEPRSTTQLVSQSHTVAAGETLYAISRKYGVSVDQIKSWNNLASNELNIGQVIRVSQDTQKEKSKPGKNKKGKQSAEEQSAALTNSNQESEERLIPEGFTQYYVQSGDLLETIAARFKVKPDSIVIWNDLPNTYLSLGQKLLIKGSIDQKTLATAADVEQLGYGQRRTVKDQSGFIKIFEEGIAKKIEDVDTEKYLALHRNLAVGSLIEIRNLMNNQKIFARVVGKLPETGLNENILIRLTPICFDRLGVIDPKTRVEVSYYED